MYRNLFGLLALSLSATVVAEMIDVDVGENGLLAFEPNEITAKAGDRLRFHFYSASAPHDVTQGSFDSPGPCIPSSPSPFYSGMMEGDDEGHPTFTINITSSDPIYFYCSIARHCQGGMVGVVNGPSGAGYTEYRSAARNVGFSNRPLDGAQGGIVGNGDDDDEEDDSSTSSMRMTSTMSRTSMSTESDVAVQTTMPSSTTLTGTVESTTASSTQMEESASSGTDAGNAAATTPSGAGKNGKGAVLLALSVLLGALVALMA